MIVFSGRQIAPDGPASVIAIRYNYTARVRIEISRNEQNEEDEHGDDPSKAVGIAGDCRCRFVAARLEAGSRTRLPADSGATVPAGECEEADAADAGSGISGRSIPDILAGS